MAWDNAVVTNAGISLLQQVLAGETLTLDKAAGGTGTVPASALMAQIGLKEQKQELPITSVKNVSNGKKVCIQITNVGLASGYIMQQVGIWAHIGNNSPVLFAILQDDTGIAIPSRTEIPDFAMNLYAVINFSNESNFSLSVEPSALVTQGELNERIKNINASEIGAETPEGAQAKAEAAAAAAVAAHNTNVAAHGGIYRKNLLHNWDFRNPVNQRGFTSTTAAGYTIDRWRSTASGHTVELTPNGLKLRASSGAEINYCLAQYIENYGDFEGKTLTLSVHIVENTLTQGCSLRWNDTAGGRITGTGLFSFTFTPSSLSSLSVGIQFWDKNTDRGEYVLIDKMKLEIGSTSTLANDPPADYGEQLMLCKRFFRLWTTEAARTEALKEVGLMRIPNPTLGTINISGTTYYYASADL